MVRLKKRKLRLRDEIAEILQLDVAPMSWPVGMGGLFEGVYDLAGDRLRRPPEQLVEPSHCPAPSQPSSCSGPRRIPYLSRTNDAAHAAQLP